MSRSEPVLIGPFGTGKSTIGRLLAAQLGVPDISLDTHQHYYTDLGFTGEEFKRRWKETTPHTADRWFHTFFPAALERLLNEYHGCVFDLGAGHTVFEDDDLFQRVKKLLEPFENVILVLPSPNLDEAVRILREREAERKINPYFLNSTEFDYFAHWVKSPHNAELARHTIYTEGKTPEQSCDEVLAFIEKR